MHSLLLADFKGLERVGLGMKANRAVDKPIFVEIRGGWELLGVHVAEKRKENREPVKRVSS